MNSRHVHKKHFQYFTVFLSAALIALSALVFFAPDEEEPPPLVVDISFDTQSVAVYDHRADSVVTMELDDYLVGVTAAEMYASYQPEALKAQAVCARTYTLYKAGRGGCSRAEGADVCTDSSHCQAYADDAALHQRWGADYQVYHDKISDAVYSTSGQVVTYDGELIEVMYHAVSGGVTEAAVNLYGNSLPYLVPVMSGGEETSSNFESAVKVTRSYFADAINEWAGEEMITADDLKLGDIVRNDTGRVETVTVGCREVSGADMRRLFGLNSTNFTIDEGEEVVFSVRGYGHGVGMSQAGANAMALDGRDYVTIIEHYFTGATVET